MSFIPLLISVATVAYSVILPELNHRSLQLPSSSSRTVSRSRDVDGNRSFLYGIGRCMNDNLLIMKQLRYLNEILLLD